MDANAGGRVVPAARVSPVPDSPVLAVLGQLVVDLLPVAGADAGPEGTAPAVGLLTGLLDAGVASRAALEALPDDRLLALVDDAALVAALTCPRVSADPPTRAEPEAERSAR